MLALLLVALVAGPRRAEAYIDPGSGSLFLQMLVAGLLALGVTIRLYWRRLKAWFQGRRGPDEPPTP